MRNDVCVHLMLIVVWKLLTADDVSLFMEMDSKCSHSNPISRPACENVYWQNNLQWFAVVWEQNKDIMPQQQLAVKSQVFFLHNSNVAVWLLHYKSGEEDESFTGKWLQKSVPCHL